MDSRIKEALEEARIVISTCDDVERDISGNDPEYRAVYNSAIDKIDEALSLFSTESESCEDAEATLKFAIFDGIANSFGKSPEQIRDTIYKNITSPELRWALEALSSHCEQEAMADERRRCAEELDARAGWKQHIETIIKLINSEVDCVQTKNGAYVNLDGVLGCLKYSG